MSDDHHLRRYSTDIASAWTVVEKLTDGDFRLSVERFHERYVEVLIAAKGPYEKRKAEVVTGETAPHAICLAALSRTEVVLHE